MRAKENRQTEEKKKKQSHSRRGWFLYGLRNGIPICMGYFAVSFALGISARNAGMDAAQSFVMSLTMVASAGQFAAINLIASGAGVIEMITTSLIVNLRYFLMSCSLTQKLKPESGVQHRFLLAYCMTDEIFGLSVSVDGPLEPWYTYGITIVSVSGWCAGTVLGVLMGNILPVWASNALGVAMYGMFLAIIIPPAKKEHFIGGLVAVSMFASWLFTVLPGLKQISSGFRVIILTIAIAGIAAVIRPHEEVLDEEGQRPDGYKHEGCDQEGPDHREQISEKQEQNNRRKKMKASEHASGNTTIYGGRR
ncbi:MAG: AzlC family ABC transporter permease [Bilifractor sp.]